MKDPKRLCQEHGLRSYQAQKAAAIMAQTIAEDVLHILQTYSVRPLHERIAEYFKPNNNK